MAVFLCVTRLPSSCLPIQLARSKWKVRGSLGSEHPRRTLGHEFDSRPVLHKVEFLWCVFHDTTTLQKLRYSGRSRAFELSGYLSSILWKVPDNGRKYGKLRWSSWTLNTHFQLLRFLFFPIYPIMHFAFSKMSKTRKQRNLRAVELFRARSWVLIGGTGLR